MKRWILQAAFFLVLAVVPGHQSFAEELTPVIAEGEQENTVTVTAKEAEKIGALYIQWDNSVAPYQVRTETGEISCGENGFLHEYILLPEASHTVTIVLPEQNPMGIYKLRIFTEEESLPEDVQIWQPPWERADIMLVAAHADDEILFMGGITPTYGTEAGARVQVVYLSEFWSTMPVREHEKLDGLWEDGLTAYPVCGNFRDVYAADLEQAKKVYDLQAMTDYLTDVIRRFQPQVVVTHDFDGEYGHGFHQLTALAVSQALEAAGDDACRTDTEAFRTYGAWDVPKAYFHLYPDNPIHMDLNVPLESMGGRTALETAQAAYLKHVSQQWCWFYVSDTYQYSCADFGLYRTNVGYDTADNMLENIVLYDEQDRLAMEERERQRRRQTQECQEQALKAALEQTGQVLARQQEMQRQEREAELQRLEQETLARETERKHLIFILLGIGIILLALAAGLMIKRGKRKKVS